MTEKEIEAAVQQCLVQCGKSKAVLICISEFLLRLRDEHHWQPDEADEVGRRVLRTIKAVDKKPDDSGVLNGA